MLKSKLSNSISKSNRYSLSIFGYGLHVSQKEVAFLAILSTLTVYLWLRQPPLLAVLMASVIAIAWAVFESFLKAIFAHSHRSFQWQFLLGLFVCAAIILGDHSPASAQFFNALEQATTQVVSTSGSGIDPSIVQTIFVLFRVLVVLAFVAGVVGLLVQAFRGGDWQPIASMIGIGLAFVIGVEVITSLMLGPGGGA